MFCGVRRAAVRLELDDEPRQRVDGHGPGPPQESSTSENRLQFDRDGSRAAILQSKPSSAARADVHANGDGRITRE